LVRPKPASIEATTVPATTMISIVVFRLDPYRQKCRFQEGSVMQKKCSERVTSSQRVFSLLPQRFGTPQNRLFRLDFSHGNPILRRFPGCSTRKSAKNLDFSEFFALQVWRAPVLSR
jgi:hypothetical protein